MIGYLKYRRKVIILWLICTVIFIAAFYLYRLPIRAVVYPLVLCLIVGGIFAVTDYISLRRKHSALTAVQKLTDELMDRLPRPDRVTDEDYQSIIRSLCESQSRARQAALSEYNDMVDYYTVWAHQIKTPIASMRITLQNEDSPLSRSLQNDLSRIEAYVNMVLTFLRLESDSTDFCFKEYDLDCIVRPAVKRFAGEFIAKKLYLDYLPIDTKIVTDEKWLSFVIEQVLSNAVKYTPDGGISLYMEDGALCIRDSGIGIAPEDLPRIFEKGYTGFNGRVDKSASGIGLYLCRRVCDALGYEISAQSQPGKGTVIRIDFKLQKNAQM